MTRSIYRPSRMDGDLLETLFVGEERHRLADAIVERVERALQSQERNHTLVVGRRGAGKTHLVSLVAHRLATGPTTPAPVVAWLPEDPLLIASYRDLLEHIVSWSEPAITVDEGAAVDELEAAISAASPAPVVVICENLDQILTGIGPEGQHRFRSFLQNDKSVLLIATSTALTSDLVDGEVPFYAFFTTSHLEPFGADTAATMLTRISEHEEGASIAPYLASERGQARLQAISHLTGGQPRMWAMLGGTLTVADLEDLVGLLTRRLDSLTPYYQEQLARLAPRQRQVISALARANHPLNAKALAETIGIDERTVSRTLHDLRHRQWVTQIQGPFADLLNDKRIRFYELSEPMVRVMFQLNETRSGKPLEVVGEFAALWFEPQEAPEPHPHVVEGQAGELPLARQLRGPSDTERHITLPTLQRVAAALEAAADGNAEALFELPTALRTALEQHHDPADPSDGLLQLQLDVHERAQRLLRSTPAPEMEWWIDQAERLTSRAQEALPLPAIWYADAWRFDDAEATVAATERTLGTDHPTTLIARSNLATRYRAAGRSDKAIALEAQA